jgi:hypothetical protein
LVKLIASQQGMHSDALCDTVRLVNGWLDRNRKATQGAPVQQATA